MSTGSTLPVVVMPQVDLMALSRLQLKWLLSDPDNLSGSLGLELAPGLLEPAAARAVEMKIERMSHEPLANHPWSTFFLIILKHKFTGVGLIGFKGVPNQQGEVEMGYGVQTDYRGQGFASQAAQGLSEWALRQPGCSAVLAETSVENTASQHVLQNSGFVLQGPGGAGLLWKKML